ncbi:hypothetical protein AWL63_12435 [Sphingomonas panacis]|uniref:Uncharacterized protein n=1 Tax=Sphingomonas panacis TaxID=1560345 RepID=A0A1B3ZB76_9SPHN|nr:hypothetical protein AWL63_12435 [Sphingomonas panacis]
MAKRLRATSAAAAAPNSNTIGGAGTGAGWPPLLPPCQPLLPPCQPLLPPCQPLLPGKPWLLDA